MSSRKVANKKVVTSRDQKKNRTSSGLTSVKPFVVEKPKWFKEREDSSLSTTSSKKSSRSKKCKGKITSSKDSVSVLKTAGSVTKSFKKSKKGGGYENTTDYHYGSDFSDVESYGDDSSDEFDQTSESDEEFHLDDPEIIGDSISSELFEGLAKPPTPLPYWLRDEPVPPLVIPETSHDLTLAPDIALRAAGIYEVLRRFYTIVRISPFRFEDFLAALQADDFSNLIVEIHIMLLKALLREEELQQTQFGPQDLKDSINSVIHFMDAMTWPEVLRSYLQSDKIFKASLAIVESCNYPFTNVRNRLEVMGYLVDQFLLTTPVRECLASDGNVPYEDHCRVCYRLGDLLCCETCPAVYHLECINPKIDGIPPDDWKCSVCTSHMKAKGVVDCVSDQEKAGLLIRHEHLGYDREGRKYWFICRRIFAENDHGNVWYYSTKAQLQELIEALDEHEYETELYRNLESIRGEIERQMDITEYLTDQKKGDKKSYIEADNEVIEKMREEKMARKQAEKEEKEKAEEQLKVEVLFDQQIGGEMEVVEEVVASEETQEESGDLPVGKPKPAKQPVPSSRWELLAALPLYRLGTENFFRGYKNQYSENPLALNKFQHQEEKDKRRHLSHKFSLTPASDFKWSGAQFGTQSALIHTFRNTILHMQQNFLTAFCHYNWPMLRRNWVSQMGQAKDPSGLAKPLAFFALIIKAAAYNPVWTDQLGHTRLQRQTLMDREERKKQEKKEEKEKKLEEDINRTYTVHYTIPLKHHVYKQRGEEYRLHGRWGWQWLSAARTYKSVDPSKLGHRGEPAKIVVNMKVAGGDKLIAVEPKLFKVIMDHKAGLPIKEASQSQVLDILSKREIKKVEYGTHVDKIINVSESLSSAARPLYPKIAKKAKLDNLLEIRMQLYEQEKLEKKEEEVKKEEEKIKEEKEAEEKRILAKESVYKRLNELKDEVGELEDILKRHPCYVHSCRDGDTSECYSPLCLRLHIAQEEIEDQEEMLQRIDAGEDISQPISRKPTGTVRVKQEVKEEKNENIDEGFVDIEGTEVKKEEVEPTADTRIYAPTAQPYSLKKPGVLSKKGLDIPVCKYITKNGKRTIFAITRWEHRKVARTYGQFSPSGFNPNAKGSALSWPYPCPRPMFKTTWFYRTAHIRTVAAAALQLRILWACLRWDDMAIKPPVNDLKQVKTTEHDLITVEYLTMRTTGHYKERTEYLKRTLIIPLDHNKKKSKDVDMTPARLGLRKRKKAETPETSEPSLSEQWIDETNMELWEIRLYYDKHIAKRHQNEMSSIYRSKQLGGAGKETPSPMAIRRSTEEAIKQQRLAMKLGTQGVQKITPTGAAPKPGVITGVSVQRSPAILGKSGVKPAEPVPLQIRHVQGSNKFEISGIKAGQRVMVKGDTLELQSTDVNGKITGVVTQIKIEGLSKIPNPVFVAAPVKPLQSKLPILGPTSIATPRPAAPRPILTKLAPTVATPVPVARATGPRPTLLLSGPAATPAILTVNGGTAVSVPASTAVATQKSVIEKIQEGSWQLAVIDGQNVLIEKAPEAPKPEAKPATVPREGEKYAPPFAILSNISPGGKANLTYKDVKPNALPHHVQAHVHAQARYHIGVFASKAAKGIPPPSRLIIPIPGYTPGTAPLVASIPASQIAVNPAAVTGQMPVRAPARVNAGTMQFKRAISTLQPRAPLTPAPRKEETMEQPEEELSPLPKSPEVSPVNDEYIKKTIQQALRGKNVNPVDQQRLRNFLDNEDKDLSCYTEAEISRVKKAKKRKFSGESDDDAFAPKIPRKAVATPIRVGATAVTPARPPKTPVSGETQVDREEKERMRSLKAAHNMEAKRLRVVMAKLNTLLHANTSILKKDISKRKSDAEKRMNAEVKAEVQEKLQEMRQTTQVTTSPVKAEARRRRKSSGRGTEDEVSPPQKAKRERKDSEKKKKTEEKKEEEETSEDIYCICKKPYDATQFYVGCDSCSNWFHGDCIGITKKMSKKMTEYICDECKKNQGQEKLYCICKQPYDESQFYICCDKCQEWYHGRCIGILAAEASSIEEYNCPSCDPESPINRANFKRLSAYDYEILKKLVKQISAHRNSAPFRVPVDRREVPSYYSIIKNPMDLQTISNRLRDHHYRHFHEFVSDLMLIFDNCRFFNPRGSKYAKLADSLEAFVAPHLQRTRQTLLS